MEIRGVDGNVGPSKVTGSCARPGPDQQDETAPAKGDRVDISPAARYLEQYNQLPEIRPEKVAEARQAIQAGRLDTPERLSVAVDRMLEDLLGE